MLLFVGECSERAGKGGSHGVQNVRAALRLLRALGRVQAIVLVNVELPSRAVYRLRGASPGARIAVVARQPNTPDRLACAAACAVYYGSDEREATIEACAEMARPRATVH